MSPEQASLAPAVVDGSRRRYLLNELLRGVSRSFYLTLRVLPEGMREPVGVAYLLARAADTIADSEVVPAPQRSAALQLFREQLMVDQSSSLAIEQLQTAFAGVLEHAAEKALLGQLPTLFELLMCQTDVDEVLIRKVVLTLSDGMVNDLQRFPTEGAALSALSDEAQLAHYTYLVAGCVGEFWTEMSIAHVASLHEWREDACHARMTRLGIRFGKALQMTNILRDVPRDLQLGRCYLPQPWLGEAGLTAAALRNARNSRLARPLLIRGIHIALTQYDAAEQYVIAIPRRCLRLRLAALWPMLIGLETLARLSRQEGWLAPDTLCKVERHWVYRMLLLSGVAVFSNRLLRWWCAQLRKGILFE